MGWVGLKGRGRELPVMGRVGACIEALCGMGCLSCVGLGRYDDDARWVSCTVLYCTIEGRRHTVAVVVKYSCGGHAQPSWFLGGALY